MPKYWGKQIFSLGSFPEVGQKQKTEKREKERNTPGTAGGPGGRDRTQAQKEEKRPKILEKINYNNFDHLASDRYFGPGGLCVPFFSSSSFLSLSLFSVF